MAERSRQRPFDPQYAERVITDLSRGLSVRKLCAIGKAGDEAAGVPPDPNFPRWEAVFDWLGQNDDFARHYARARVKGCEAIADELFIITDDRSADREWVVSEKTGDLVRVTDHEHINRSRLRADVRKWYLSKIVPKIYGDRLEVDHKGQIDLVSRLTEGRQRAALEDKSSALEGEFTQVIEHTEEGSDLV